MRADGSANRRQFLITTALVTALAGFLLVTSIGGVVDELRKRDDDAVREVEVRARILGDSAERIFNDVRRNLMAAATATSPERLAGAIANTGAVRAAAIFDQEGRLKLRTTSLALVDTDVSRQPFLETLRAGTRFAVFAIERSGARTAVPIAALRLDDAADAFVGAAVAEIASDDFQAIYRQASRGGSVALIGANNRIIAGWPAPADGSSLLGRTPDAMPSFAGVLPRSSPGSVAIEQRQDIYLGAMTRASFGGTIIVAVPRPPGGLAVVAREPTVLMAGTATLAAIALLIVLHHLAIRRDDAEAALRASQDIAGRQLAELESLYNTALVGLAFVDKDLRYRRINAHLARINGIPQQAHIGRTLHELWPELGKAVEPMYRRVLETGASIVDHELSGTTRADSLIHTWRCNYHPAHSPNGEVIGVNIVVQDVTDRKRAEAGLRDSEQRFRIAAECTSDLIYEWNLRTGQVHWFGDIDEHLGYVPGAVARTRAGWEALIHPDDRVGAISAAQKHLAAGGEAVAEYRVRRRDGDVLIWSERARVVADAEGRPLLRIGAITDLTDRRRSVATERRFLDAIEHMPEGLALWDRDDRLVFCNERYRELSGAAGPMLKPGIIFVEFLLSSMKAGLLNEAVGREETWLAERLERRRDPAGPLEIRREGRWLRVYEHRLPSGDVIVALGDIHAQKQQEEQLRQAQKMEAVGHLTGGVAHDFNNLLAVIQGNLELLEEQTDPTTTVHDMLAAALRAARRGAELTQRLLAFARRQPLNPEITDPSTLVDELVPMLRRTLGETIEIVSRAEPHLGQVTADRGQLENVLINLCVNARDAMPKGGSLTIDLRNFDFESADTDRPTELQPGPYVLMCVSDTGMGMSREIQRRAFEPFFTTKEIGKGSGLGLSTAYGFVKQSGGHITLYSEPGHGTTVKLYFPRAQRAGETAPAAPAREAVSAPGHETILLVEDDPDVRALAATVLSSLGYKILEAANGHAALNLLGDAGHIDLLLTDVILPGGMLGPTLAAEVVKRRPQTRVLYMSGYTEDALIHGGRLDEGVELISKPFRKTELATKIRLILRGGREV